MADVLAHELVLALMANGIVFEAHAGPTQVNDGTPMSHAGIARVVARTAVTSQVR